MNITEHKQAIRDAKRQQDLHLVGDLYVNLAESYFDIHGYARAEAYYKLAIKAYEQVSVPSMIADVCYRLGVLYTNLNRMADAEASYKQALAIYGSYKRAELTPSQYDDYATAYNGLATLYGEWGENAKALDYMQKAKSIYTSLAEENAAYEVDLAMLLSNMGLLYCNMGEYPDAFDELIQALEIYGRLETQDYALYAPEAVIAYVNMGVLHLTMEDYSAAVKYLESARKRYTELSESEAIDEVKADKYMADLATVQSNISIAYTYMDEYDEAEKALLNALKLRRKLVNYSNTYIPDLADVYSNMAMLYSTWDKFDEGLAAYNEAIAITESLAQQEPDRYLASLASLYRSMGILYSCDNTKSKEAIGAYNKAINAYKRFTKGNPQEYIPNMAGLYFLIGEVYSLSEDVASSETMYSSAYNIYNSLDNTANYNFEKALCLIYLAGAQEGLGDDALAEQSIMSAYDILKNGEVAADKREQWAELLETLEEEMGDE